MGSPTNEYFQRERLVYSALQNVDLGNLERKFEQPDMNDDFDDIDLVDVVTGEVSKDTSGEVSTFSTAPPNRVAFYDGEKKVGELYFTEDPMRLVELDDSFKPYASSLRTELGL